ncbi:HesB/YadR/YfhF family protein [Domibacillus sp. A3M-37]|uniref:HesB/YadR/YfhF family protein n=1 Tax=Domibacillus sp. A3M-37 TaxID=2962037 RepID=UPI0020B637FF|nr:HesB/YadR/YfhF family protein [Domibacillus sp. A3M-37]MCP3762688.1 HesB/YadR/YfhF family protein [Domibacillus sp. A3M-37]
MKIDITSQAKKWFKEEMQVEKGDSVRFYVRYGGSSPLHEGFSLGVAKDEPVEPAVTAVHDGITYFVEEKDVWYFDNHHLKVGFNAALQEPDYDYIKETGATQD